MHDMIDTHTPVVTPIHHRQLKPGSGWLALVGVAQAVPTCVGDADRAAIFVGTASTLYPASARRAG